MLKVKLQYFKESGKYYGEGEIDSYFEHMHDIVSAIKELHRERRLPGLIAGHTRFYTLIDVPEHSCNCPYLIPGIFR